MRAKEELIKAYAFYSLRREVAGDSDIGSKGTHKPVRSRRRSVKQDDFRYSTGFCYFVENRKKAINTNSLIAMSMRAGSIISAGEGKEDHEVAFSRVYYSDMAKESEKAILARYLVTVLKNRFRGQEHRIIKAQNVIVRIAYNVNPRNQAFVVEDNVIYETTMRLVDRLEANCLKRVGEWLKLDTPH